MDCEQFIVAVIRLAYFVPSASRLPPPPPPPPPPPFALALLPPKSSLPKHLMPVGVSVKLQTWFGDDAPQLILLDVLDGCFVI